MQLPALRQDLELYPGSSDRYGNPIWIIEDIANHAFFSIDYPTFEILSRWGMGNVEEILMEIRSDTLLELAVEDIEKTVDFLLTNNLDRVATSERNAQLYAASKSRRNAFYKNALHQYLFFRIPILKPKKILKKLSMHTELLYTRKYWLFVLVVFLIGIYLVSQQYSSFMTTFTSFGGTSQLILFFSALAVSKILHEFGHAVSAYRFGCKVPTMGVALLVLWPVLYTDTNDSWKLRSRKQRLIIAASGILVELNIAVFALLLWSLLPEGPLKAAMFFLAAVSWVVTLGINLNPFVRFDGYYLLSDTLNIPNLHDKAFSLGRWWIRRYLWGLTQEARNLEGAGCGLRSPIPW